MKTAFIMRGVPGSGKSTVASRLAEALKNEGHRTSVHSTDDLCMIDGTYQWDAERAPARHEQNLSNFIDSLERGDNYVFCDNTNVKRKYFKPYVEAAENAGYKVVFVEPLHPSDVEAAQRNAHGVPLEVICKMLEDWESSQSSTDEGYLHFTYSAFNREMATFFGFGTIFGIIVGMFLVTI